MLHVHHQPPSVYFDANATDRAVMRAMLVYEQEQIQKELDDMKRS